MAEVDGGRVSLHELVRNALRDDLRRRDPQRYDRLRCAIADHLLVRALSTSDTRLLADMTQLIDDADRRRDVEADAVTAVDPGAPGARRVGDPVDGGPGGLLVHIRRMIYAEAGLDAPDLYPDDDDELQAAAVDAVRDATRPDLLVTNPLVDRAPGGRVGERVAWVQDAIRSGLGTAFGSGDGDRVLRQVVALGDLDPETNHVQAMSQLSMSRATYFRHLRRARERLARALVERVTDQTP